MNLEQRLASIHPHPRQIAWQETEFYAFVHFTVNTYADKEWSDGIRIGFTQSRCEPMISFVGIYEG